MEFDELAGMVSLLFPVGLGSVVGLMLSVAVLVMMMMGRRVPAVAAVAGPLLPAVMCSSMAIYASLQWDNPDASVAQQALVQATLTRAFGLFAVGAVSLPLLLGLAVQGARHQPRETVRAAVAFGGVALVVLVCFAGSTVDGVNPFFVQVRAIGYGLAGLLVVAAMLSGKAEEGNGAEVGATASLIFAILVFAGEVSGRGLCKLFLVQGVDSVPLDGRSVLVTEYMAIYAAELPWMYVVMGTSLWVASWGIFWVAKQGGRRGALSGAGAIWLVALVGMWFAGDPSVDTMIAVADRLP